MHTLFIDQILGVFLFLLVRKTTISRAAGTALPFFFFFFYENELFTATSPHVRSYASVKQNKVSKPFSAH